MKLFRILAIWFFIIFASTGINMVQAQATYTENAATSVVEEPQVEMADTLREDGKIYVVVIVLLTVLMGMIAYLITLDRKVSKLEKQVQN